MSRPETSVVRAPSTESVIDEAIRKLEAARSAIQLGHFRSGLELLSEAEGLVHGARYVIEYRG